MPISADTKLVALIGNPVAHSVSPVIHNSAFRNCGLDLVYLAFDVVPERLGDAISAMRTFGFAGANVTIPHKQEVIFFLDNLTDRAQAVGAVNTIVPVSDPAGGTVQLVGDNTDVAGFVQSLESVADRLAGSEALVWGSGGVARAVVYALLEELDMPRVHLVCRSPERGDSIAGDLDDSGSRVSVVKWEYAPMAMQQAKLLINATPLGMTPHTDGTPCRHPELIRADHIIVDLVYNPIQTTLLKQAEKAGALAIGGLEMLLGQAAASFTAWTGASMPVETLRDEVRNALGLQPE